jgi:putative glycosyltransferase (TIGR04372 family)
MNAPHQARLKPTATVRPAASKEMLARGMEFHREGRLTEAIECYENALIADPRSSDALHLLGLAKAAEGQIERGIEFIKQAVKAQPRFPAAFFNLGNLLRKQNKLQAAVTAYQRAIALQPKFPDAHCNMGCTLDALGRLDEAVIALRRAIADQRDYAEAYRNLGLVQQKRGQLDEAAEALRRAIALKPDHASAQGEIGLVLQAQGKWSEAIEVFGRVLALNPHYTRIWLNLGVCLQAEEKLSEAEIAYRRVIELQPEFPEALRLLKTTIEAQVWTEDVWRKQRDALALNDECVLALNNLGSALLLQGKIAEAFDTWNLLSPVLSLPQKADAFETGMTASTHQQTCTLETAELRLILDFKIILLTGSTVTACAPAFSLVATGANKSAAFQQLEHAILKKALGPIIATEQNSRHLGVKFEDASSSTKRAVRETVRDSRETLSLFAQQLNSVNRRREALECFREAHHLGSQPIPLLSFHGLLAATFDYFDEAIALYVEAIQASLTREDDNVFWTGPRKSFPSIASLLEEASQLYGIQMPHVQLRPLEEFEAASTTVPLPVLKIEACNYLAETLINYHDDFSGARVIYLTRDQLQKECLQICGVGPVDTLFLGSDWVRNVGHIAFLGQLVKMCKLGLSPWKHIVVLTQEYHIANSPYLNHWRKHITVVTDPKQIDRFQPLTIVCGFRFSTLFPFPDREPLYNSEYVSAVEEKWESADSEPLLSLAVSERDNGWRSLEPFGVKRGDKFVCLHVRESGFHTASDGHRNAPLEDYFTAIEAITQRGVWVIRMGDSSMSPMPSMKRVIDYPHTDAKSPSMDVFLCAECHFFIGTHSGLSHVPYSFGRPSVMTNWVVTGLLPPFPRDGLFLPKMIRLTKEQRLLSFRELIGETWSARCHSAATLKDYHAQLVNNTASEICEVVLEMLDGPPALNIEDMALLKKFSSLLPEQSARGHARPGTAFLRRHRKLL